MKTRVYIVVDQYKNIEIACEEACAIYFTKKTAERSIKEYGEFGKKYKIIPYTIDL